jgi:hypothetical protein
VGGEFAGFLIRKAKLVIAAFAHQASADLESEFRGLALGLSLLRVAVRPQRGLRRLREGVPQELFRVQMPHLRYPKDHPLWKFENAIITPHIAGRSDQDAGRVAGTVKENLVRFVEGKPLIHVVDKQKGY